MLNIYHIEKYNFVNGNGCRYVLWTQGCDLGCKDCWNKETWSFKENNLKSVDGIFYEINKIKNKIDGVTFTGGEPFLQAKELYNLSVLIKKFTKLDIQIFSGFEKNELTSKYQKKLLDLTDILVAGRLKLTEKNNNQKIYILNPNVNIWEFNNKDIQIDINKNGDLQITGYPQEEFIENLKDIK